MSLNIYLTTGESIVISETQEIDDFSFSSTEVLKYILDNISKKTYFKIKQCISGKIIYIFTSHICKIEIK